MSPTTSPVNFQALVRDYGWDIAQRAYDEWLLASAQRHAPRSNWRGIFRQALTRVPHTPVED